MTVVSNSKKKAPNKFILYIKRLWRDDKFPLLLFPLLIVGGSIGGYIDYTTTNTKVEYITTNKPLLVCSNRIFCSGERYNNYNIVLIDGTTKIEVLDEKNEHKEYVRLDHVEYVQVLK